MYRMRACFQDVRKTVTPLCSCLSGCGTSRLDRHRSMYRQLFKARSFGCRAVFSSPCPAQYVVKSRLATTPAVAEGTAETLTEADYDYPPVPFRASIDFKSIVENVELHTKNGKDRFTRADPAKVAQLYQQFVQLTIQTNNVRSERNTVSNSMKVLSLGEFRAQLQHKPWDMSSERSAHALGSTRSSAQCTDLLWMPLQFARRDAGSMSVVHRWGSVSAQSARIPYNHSSSSSGRTRLNMQQSSTSAHQHCLTSPTK